MKTMVIKNYDTKEELTRIKVRKLDSLFGIAKLLSPEMLGLPGDVRIVDAGITSFSSKNGVMSNDPEINEEAEVVRTGVNSSVIGPGAKKMEEKEPHKVRIAQPESWNPEEIDLRLAVTAYPEGYLINTGKFTTSIFGTRHPAYFSSIGKRNFKSSSAEYARLFSSIKAVADYLEKNQDTFRFMVETYGYEFSVEPSCPLFAPSLDDIPKKDQKHLERLTMILDEINATDDEEEEETVECGIATDRELEVEALRRLQKLNVMDTVIKSFQKRKLFMSEFGGILYDLNEDATAAVAEAKKRNLFPYAVCRTQTEIGDMYTVLGVSRNKEEWGFERPTHNGECLAYVYNANDPLFSEYGDVIVEGANGGIIRTA